MTGTTLRTERLILRRHGASDLEEVAALWADPGVTEHIGGRPLSREEAWRNIQRYAGHWALFGWGYWTIRDRATDAFLGEAGLMDSRRDTRPSFEGTPEAGWALAPQAQGRGYAREAVAAVLAWADARGMGRTMCMIDPANAPSIRLAGRLGYRPLAEATYRDAPTLLFERTAG